MLKMLLGLNGRPLIVIGLSHSNLDQLRQGDPIKFGLEDFELDGIDLLIAGGETEETIIREFQKQGLVPKDFDYVQPKSAEESFSYKRDDE